MENMEVIKTPEEVQSRIRELGAEIAKAYGTEPLTMLVVMNGGLFFAAKLAEAIDSDDFYIDYRFISKCVNILESDTSINVVGFNNFRYRIFCIRYG